MDGLVVNNLAKDYGGRRVFGGVSFTLPQGGTICLSGPSGGGKTTLLHVLCGLALPGAGEILYGERTLSTPRAAVPPHRRGMAMAFQAPALFPHMTVWENLRFAARGAADGMIRDLCERLYIADIKDSLPQQISGGQAKRAELARALAARPRVLLLDEPTAHLDAKLRGEVADAVVSCARETGAAVLYVTHDEAEQARLGAPILRLEGGVLKA